LGTYTEIIMMMTSLLWGQLYLEHSRSVQYFAKQFSFTLQLAKC